MIVLESNLCKRTIPINHSIELVAAIQARHPLTRRRNPFAVMFGVAAKPHETSGVLTHCTFRADKTDVYPDSRLVAAYCG